MGEDLEVKFSMTAPSENRRAKKRLVERERISKSRSRLEFVKGQNAGDGLACGPCRLL